MNATRDQIVTAARQHLGVRWRHQGRTHHGLDCAGLVVLVGRELGLLAPDHDVQGYSRRPDGFSFLAAFREAMDEKPLHDALPGDAVTFIDGPYPCHVGVMSFLNGSPYFIHAYAGLGKVVEQPYSSAWRMKATHCFAFRGVAE